jgi:hypothetical protein
MMDRLKEQTKADYSLLGPGWYAFSWAISVVIVMWLTITFAVVTVGVFAGGLALITYLIESPTTAPRWFPAAIALWMLASMPVLFFGFWFVLWKLNATEITQHIRVFVTRKQAEARH